MSNVSLSIGSRLEVHCPKCRKIRDHEIVSFKDDKPDKVKCTICTHQRKYRVPATPKTAEEKLLLKNTETRRKRAISQRSLWEKLSPSLDSNKAHSYSMSASYKIKDLIEHPVFGLGQVQGKHGVKKIEVLFKDGLKIMRCK